MGVVVDNRGFLRYESSGYFINIECTMDIMHYGQYEVIYRFPRFSAFLTNVMEDSFRPSNRRIFAPWT